MFGAGRSDLLTRAAFTDTAIEQRGDLDEFRILHFATHGVVTPPRPGCPAQPALLTSFGGPGSDGLLEFGDVFDLDLDADLVILSACDTASTAGLAATRAGGHRERRRPGARRAGARVHRRRRAAGDRQPLAGARASTRRPRGCSRASSSSPPGTSLGDALRAAQQRLMDDPETSHPFYWSGFALIGDGERPLFSGS